MIYKVTRIWFIEAINKKEALEKIEDIEPYSEKANANFKVGPGSIKA